jgi:uncharacterized protein
MQLRTATDVAAFIVADPWRRTVLEAVRRQRLPDWAVGAGFIRSAVWDALHGYAEPTPLPDVDVLFFDGSDVSHARETAIEKALDEALPNISWSAKNQARMHLRARRTGPRVGRERAFWNPICRNPLPRRAEHSTGSNRRT